MKKVLITGGAGFIGFHLAEHLLKLGYQVVSVDNFFRAEPDEDFQALLKKPGIEFLEADLTDRNQWNRVGSGYDHVYHLAAVNGTRLFYEIPHEVLRINLLTTLNVLEWFKENNSHGKILFTSSNEGYAGANEAFGKLPLPTPEDVPLVVADVFNPRWSYGGTKLIGEQLFIHFSKNYRFRMVIVRPHNFFGPRAGWHHVIPELIERIKKKVDPFVLYSPDHTRSFCYILDGIKAMEQVMTSKDTDNAIYNIGTPEEIPIREIAQKLFKIAGWEPEKLEISEAPIGSVTRRVPDITKIQTEANWNPETSFDEGLRLTFDWYKNRNR